MSWLSDIFSSKKTKTVAPNVYFPSQDPSYNLVKKNLEDIIASRGLGYTPEMISSVTSPYATARRASIQNYELPAISSQASARGLGRSTIPVSRAALSTQEGERDIGEKIADLTQSSEQLKAQQYQNALSGMAGLSSAEIEAQNLARGYAATAENANRATAATKATDLFGRGLAGISGAITGGMTTGTPLGALAGAAGGFSGTTKEKSLIDSLFEKYFPTAKAGGAARVNIATEELPEEIIKKYPYLLGGNNA